MNNLTIKAELPLKQALFEFIQQQEYPVTFNQIVKASPGCEGQKIFGTSLDNLVFWTGINEDLQFALMDLIKHELVKMEVCNTDVYLAEGIYPQYPLANGYQNYESFHWLPVVLSAVQITEIH